jgi:hypothetical protein
VPREATRRDRGRGPSPAFTDDWISKQPADAERDGHWVIAFPRESGGTHGADLCRDSELAGEAGADLCRETLIFGGPPHDLCRGGNLATIF